ncbi:MAG: MmcQ/YjbR family DNA-binding protein [Gemmatimonadales bacterium]
MPSPAPKKRAPRRKGVGLARLRRLCLRLPDVEEFMSHGAPTFRVRKGRTFAMYADAGTHHGAGRPGVWCKATPDNQEMMLRAVPARFFKPPYVGPSGWIGVWLDGPCDWAELSELLADGHGQVAPRRKQPRAKT